MNVAVLIGIGVGLVVLFACLGLIAYLDRREKAERAAGDALMARSREILASIPAELAEVFRSPIAVPVATADDSFDQQQSARDIAEAAISRARRRT